MKKRAVILAINDVLRKEYRNQISSMIGDLVDVEEYTMGVGTPPPRGDINIVPTRVAGIMAKSIYKELPVYEIKADFTRDIIEKLRAIREGSSVLLISYEWTYLIECIELLKEMGIRHLKFIPYHGETDKSVIENVKIAIYMGEPFFRPAFIREFIDIGWRKVTPVAYREILGQLGIEPEIIAQRLLAVEAQMPVRSNQINWDVLMAQYFSVGHLRLILDAMPNGILITDNQGSVIAYNRVVCGIFKIGMSEMIGRNIEENVKWKRLYKQVMDSEIGCSRYYSDPELDKKYMVSRRSICYLEEKYQDIIVIEEMEMDEKHPAETIAHKPKSLRANYTFEDIVGDSREIREAIDYGKRYAQTDMPVLILGETGTGKEMFAQAIHNASDRGSQPFVAVNCAAIPEELLESEFFGYQKGSFTGALPEGKKGFFEAANGGTIFLDEIGDSDRGFQVKLLRTLQEHEIVRVGSYERIPIDVRVIAATNHRLTEKTEFRKDLFYRISACVLRIPPLRQRRQDIVPISQFYLHSIGAGEKAIGGKLADFLMGCEWEGNVRELKNCVEYLGYFGKNPLTPEDLPMLYKEQYDLKRNRRIPTLEGLSKEDGRLAVAVLELLCETPCGRRRLHGELLGSGFDVSEYRLRGVMDFLQSNGYVEKQVGRNGTIITAMGREVFVDL